MIKIYKVNSIEKFKYLLSTLHERGSEWASGDPLDDEHMAGIHWILSGCNGIAVYREGNKVTVSHIEEIEDEIGFYECKGKEYTIIEDVKLPKPSEKPKVTEIYFHDDTGGKLGGDRIFRVTEEIQVQPCQSDPVQPNHYRQGKTDLFETWYLTYPFNEFRAIMKSHIAKYLHRYQDKNGTEDLDKASYCIQRLREYEEREANG